MPSTGQRALDIMCGAWGASRCTPLRWFHYMGDAENNPYVPFQITYVNTTKAVDGYIPMDAPIVPCNQSINVSIAWILFFNESNQSYTIQTNECRPKQNFLLLVFKHMSILMISFTNYETAEILDSRE